MAAPQKPWEGLPLSEPRVLNSNSGISGIPVPLSETGGGGGGGNGAGYVQPPPLPSRSSRVYNPRGTTSSYMHSYPFGSYMGGFPGGGLYPSYGYGGMPPQRRFDDFEHRFIQMAEESSAPAFQSIEAFVRSLSSVSMMLESSYQAMYMSFRAVLSVAENFARLRSLIGQFLGSLAALKTVAWFYNKIRRLLGLVSEKKLQEEAWKMATEENQQRGAGAAAGAAGVPNKMIWPILGFFALMFGGPYLIFKFVGFPQQQLPGGEWRPLEEGESVAAMAMFDFNTTQDGELAMKRGEQLLIAMDPAKQKRRGGWLLAARPDTGEKGYVPANRIAKLRMVRNPNQQQQGLPRPIRPSTTTWNPDASCPRTPPLPPLSSSGVQASSLSVEPPSSNLAASRHSITRVSQDVLPQVPTNN